MYFRSKYLALEFIDATFDGSSALKDVFIGFGLEMALKGISKIVSSAKLGGIPLAISFWFACIEDASSAQCKRLKSDLRKAKKEKIAITITTMKFDNSLYNLYNPPIYTLKTW